MVLGQGELPWAWGRGGTNWARVSSSGLVVEGLPWALLVPSGPDLSQVLTEASSRSPLESGERGTKREEGGEDRGRGDRGEWGAA